MIILEICPFSAGICGVWARVLQEAKLFVNRGYDVTVFSSNIKRGSGKIEFAKENEIINSVRIKRFKAFWNFGKNTFFWNFKKQALNLRPDIIITHVYRHYHSTRALKIAKDLRIPCILVTHAPFLDKNLRDDKSNFMIWFYDKFIGKRILNNYSRIFSITKWEIPYLRRLGVEKGRVIYSPNGVPNEFFTTKSEKKKNKKSKSILFLGRIAPIKGIETLLKAFKLTLDNNQNINLILVGPIEKAYGLKIEHLIKNLNLKNKIKFHKPVYNLNEKIKIIDSSDLFILPSKREAMPQALIEAMSRGKIVISSKTDGGKEIIKNSKNGYLFDIGNEKQLSNQIIESLRENKKNKLIRKNAKETVKKFSWKKLIEFTSEIIDETINEHKKP